MGFCSCFRIRPNNSYREMIFFFVWIRKYRSEMTMHVGYIKSLQIFITRFTFPFNTVIVFIIDYCLLVIRGSPGCRPCSARTFPKLATATAKPLGSHAGPDIVSSAVRCCAATAPASSLRRLQERCKNVPTYYIEWSVSDARVDFARDILQVCAFNLTLDL